MAVTTSKNEARGAASTGGPSGGGSRSARIYGFLRQLPLWVIVTIWVIPTFGLFVNSFRPKSGQRGLGWWQALTAGNQELPASEQSMVNIEDLTLDNYADVFSASSTAKLSDSLLNSFAIAIPATIIPIAIAAFAAYGFAWIDFKGRDKLFIVVVSLLAIPLQVALIPLLRLYNGGAHLTIPFLEKTITVFPDLDLAGTSTAVWLTHTGFAMPFAIFLLHNYISGLPKDLFESARIDGADHFTIFWRLVLPLSVPVLAAFAIFQFLWTWNDYLIAVVMLSSNQDAFPTTIRIANLAGDFGRNEHLLASAAFVQAFVPLVVFFSLQRFFVRGILAGSVKG